MEDMQPGNSYCSYPTSFLRINSPDNAHRKLVNNALIRQYFPFHGGTEEKRWAYQPSYWRCWPA